MKTLALSLSVSLIAGSAHAVQRREIAQMNEMKDRPSASASAQPHARNHAEAKITVQSSSAAPFDQTSGPLLTEVRITETFAGEISGESVVRALQVALKDGSASLVSMQRVRGKLGPREGSFVLKGSETVSGGKITATWSVVPGSGTGELSGLRGEGGFTGEFGKASTGTLDYWFE